MEKEEIQKEIPYWNYPQEKITEMLKSDPDSGLTEAEAENRLRETGLNVLKERQKLTPLDLLLNQFKSPILLILLIATVISAALGNWVDAIIIFVIILFSAVLSFVQEFNADKAAEMMQMRLKIKTDVIREGKKKSVPAEVIVPGDIIELSAGSIIPADAIILRAEDFFVNQSVLTGETFPVEKTAGTSAENAELEAMNNVVFMGTTVSSGYARCIVMKTGSATAFGQVAKRMVLKPPATEFERGVNKLSYLLTIVMLVLVLIIFAANIYFRRPVLDSLIFSIALAVGLTPQLLPAIININLSKGSQAMAKRGVIVRRLEAIENFGSIDILCTDKTGTLTEGAVTLSGALDIQGKESEDVLRSAVLNAGLQAGMVNQLDEAILKKESLPESGIEKLDEIPYDFIRKRLSVLVREGDEISLIMKGSVKDVLAVCSQARMDQQTVPLTSELIHQIEEKMAEWNSEG
ncbi:MAG TPA: HAD-IC family P-type ATPase, partial [Flexilinea sp.]|nr:HAD-IC family P-type ATPase [Flexilinea sp.]